MFSARSMDGTLGREDWKDEGTWLQEHKRKLMFFWFGPAYWCQKSFCYGWGVVFVLSASVDGGSYARWCGIPVEWETCNLPFVVFSSPYAVSSCLSSLHSVNYYVPFRVIEMGAVALAQKKKKCWLTNLNGNSSCQCVFVTVKWDNNTMIWIQGVICTSFGILVV